MSTQNDTMVTIQLMSYVEHRKCRAHTHIRTLRGSVTMLWGHLLLASVMALAVDLQLAEGRCPQLPDLK